MMVERAAQSRTDAETNDPPRANAVCVRCGAALRSTNERAASLCAYHLYVKPEPLDP